VAVWAAARAPRAGGGLLDAWASVRGAPAWLIAAAVGLPVMNWLFTSAVFWVLTGRYGRVGAGEMSCLIGSAWLMNYIPMRPGLFGRVAYHRTVNGIAISDSVRVLAYSIGAGAVGDGGRACDRGLGAPGNTRPVVAAVLLAPAAGFLAVGTVMGRRAPGGWRLGVAVFFRYLDALTWVARYLVVFELIGSPVDLAQAAAVAGVSQVVLVIPLAGNGLGLREWAVGWAAASLPAWYSAGSAASEVTVGVTADLVNRAAELLAAGAIGGVCTMLVARRVARSGQTRESKTTA